MVVGPYQTFEVGAGVTADLYLLRYAEDGRPRSPQTEQLLKNALPGATDVFLFSHGWNTVFAQAVDRYRSFIAGYMQQRQQFGLAVPAGYRPLLVGIIWPSTSFVMPSEAGPEIGAAPDPDGLDAAQTEEMLRLVSASLPAEADAVLTELVDGRFALDPRDARRVAEILLAGLRPTHDPDDGSHSPSVEEFLEACALMEGASEVAGDPADFGTVGGRATAGPVVAGDFSLDPRSLLRAATVWTMKARAGTVGATGVAALVRHILANSGARLHLIGHSFGARLLLSALAVAPPVRPARSMLLLQPAVNRWCFAADVAGTGRAGGYQKVLEQVEQPILATFSRHDVPLSTFFHLALRGGSLGEPAILAFGNEELYGALGGFGPAGLGELAETQQALPPGPSGYLLDGGRQVIAIDGGVEIDGEPAIDGHADVSNPATWWALHSVTAAG